MVWDSFHGHLTDAVKDLLARWHVDVAVIPSGLTPVLQPLDKRINKPFKAKLWILYETRMVDGPFTYTLSGKKRAPSKELGLTWINRAWNQIPRDLIQKLFKSCGIANTVDGSDDNAVWDEENKEENAEEVVDNEFETNSEGEEEQYNVPAAEKIKRLFSEPTRFFSEPPCRVKSITNTLSFVFFLFFV